MAIVMTVADEVNEGYDAREVRNGRLNIPLKTTEKNCKEEVD